MQPLLTSFGCCLLYEDASHRALSSMPPGKIRIADERSKATGVTKPTGRGLRNRAHMENSCPTIFSIESETSRIARTGDLLISSVVCKRARACVSLSLSLDPEKREVCREGTTTVGNARFSHLSAPAFGQPCVTQSDVFSAPTRGAFLPRLRFIPPVGSRVEF